jgi:hypothetical protein
VAPKRVPLPLQEEWLHWCPCPSTHCPAPPVRRFIASRRSSSAAIPDQAPGSGPLRVLLYTQHFLSLVRAPQEGGRVPMPTVGRGCQGKAKGCRGSLGERGSSMTCSTPQHRTSQHMTCGGEVLPCWLRGGNGGACDEEEDAASFLQNTLVCAPAPPPPLVCRCIGPSSSPRCKPRAGFVPGAASTGHHAGTSVTHTGACRQACRVTQYLQRCDYYACHVGALHDLPLFRPHFPLPAP